MLTASRALLILAALILLLGGLVSLRRSALAIESSTAASAAIANEMATPSPSMAYTATARASADAYRRDASLFDLFAWGFLGVAAACGGMAIRPIGLSQPQADPFVMPASSRQVSSEEARAASQAIRQARN